jgi:protein-S-isoprenylcysteine O-methyltransferase Ste14
VKLFLKNLLFTLLIFGTVAVYAPLLIASGRRSGPIPSLLIMGIFFLVLGLGIYLWTVWDFASVGKGTPLPLDAPRKLVVCGLYRYIRNPMYLGVLLVILGWAMVFADAWLLGYALAVFVAVHVFVLFYEEPRLKHLYGAQYEAYSRAVGRWLPCLRVGERSKFRNNSS